MNDDHTLVARVLSGDLQAFRLLIRQHERLVGHMIGRVVKNQEELEELSQDVFLKVHDKLSEFNFQSKLSTWIATIAYRHAINFVRKSRLSFSEIPEEESLSARFIEVENPETVLSDKDMDQFVLTLVDQLPLQYKTVLTLYHLEGISYEEIGSITGMPEGTVKNYIFRARTLLKEKIMKHLRKDELL
jgi:RNA polymerase sigma factor (sigma-70 family)